MGGFLFILTYKPISLIINLIKANPKTNFGANTLTIK